MYAVFKTAEAVPGRRRATRSGVEKLPEMRATLSPSTRFSWWAGETLKLGQPLVGGAKVEAKIVTQGLGKKLIVFKFRRRKKTTRRKNGHRQPFTAPRSSTSSASQL